MRSLLISCVLIALAAMAAPQIFTHFVKQPSRATSANVATEENILPGAAEGEGETQAESGDQPAAHSVPPRQVAIEARRDGHFYVDAVINDAEVQLIVDTGATVVALRVSDAEAAGIRPVKADFTHPVQTANGQTMAAETVLDRVSVRDIELNNVRALVVPDEQLSMSLLGGSFLNGLERFEVADGTLIFEN